MGEGRSDGSIPSSSRAWISRACSGSRDSWAATCRASADSTRGTRRAPPAPPARPSGACAARTARCPARPAPAHAARRPRCTPRGHREGTGGQPRQAGDDDRLLRKRTAGDARHQGEVRDQPVHRAEDGGAQPAAVHIAVGVIVAVGHMRRRRGIHDLHDGHIGTYSLQRGVGRWRRFPLQHLEVRRAAPSAASKEGRTYRADLRFFPEVGDEIRVTPRFRALGRSGAGRRPGESTG